MQIIRDYLFTAYPQDAPDEHELSQLDSARAALRVAQAAKRRRNAIANAPPDLPPPQVRRTSLGQESPTRNTNAAGTSAAAAAWASAAVNLGTTTAPGATTTTGAGRGRGRGKKIDSTTGTATAPGATRDPPLPKPKKPYTPGIGTANYAFLICLLQAHRGPENLEFLTKHDLMSRAEASGLSNKPIMPEAPPQGGFRRENSQQFYSGWSSFKTAVNHGLAAEYSNPKKIKLTFEGMALAERLYRDAVVRGKVNPVAGLPATGPLLFQGEERHESGSGAAAAAARQAQEAAGLGPGALPSAALRRSRSDSLGPGGSNLGGAAAAVGGRQPSSAALAAAAAALRRASGGGSSAWPPANDDQYYNDEDDPLEVPLAQRLHGRAGGGNGRPPMHPARKNTTTAAAHGGGNTAGGGASGGGGGNSMFLDLAGEDTSDEEQYNRIPSAAECRGEGLGGGGQQQQQQQQRRQDDDIGEEQTPPRRRNGGSGAVKKHRISDEHVAMMMEMGFDDKKARKALRKSLGNIEDAVEIVTAMSSADESSEGGDDAVVQEGEERQRQREAARMRGNVAAATAAAAAAGVPLSRPRPAAGGTATHARGHIRTGSQPTARPRLDPTSQPSQPDYLFNNNSEPQQPSQQQQRQRQQRQSQNEDVTTTWWVQENEIRLPPLPPNRRFSEEYEVVLLVDGREQYSRSGTANRNDALQIHLSRMRGAGLAVEHRTLPIGDALWVARSRRNPTTEYVLDYILERKSLTDLLSSIKDSNRYTSQKYFLNRSGIKNLYYLVEGDPEVLPNPRDVKTVKSAAGSTEIIDGFRVLRTKGVQETFRLYQSMTEAVVQLYSNLTTTRSNTNSGTTTTTPTTTLTFDAFKEHMRQQNQGSTTVHDIWGRMLVEIPGLGPDGAAAVLYDYPVPKLLYEAYKKALREGIQSGRGGVAVAQELLVGLRGENGQGRALGPDKAKKVYQALFMNRWNLQS